MNNFTFNDSGGNQTRKTKRWLKLLTFCMMILVAPTGFGQTTGTIQIGAGNGTVNGSTAIPVSNYVYNYSQQIVTASEFAQGGGVAGDITKIRYKPTVIGTITVWNSWTVWIGNTTKTEFATDTDWVALADMTQVFTGIIPAAVANDWFEIEFTVPFDYTGGNLVVAVHENTLGWTSSPTFSSYTSTPNSGIMYRDDTTNPSPATPPTAFARVAVLPQIQFEGVLADCTVPTSLTATNIEQTTADLGWTNSGTLFDVEWGPQGFTQGTGTSGTSTTNTYQVTGLSPMTTYDFYVRQDCSGDESYWAGPFSFTTACGTVATLFENFDSYGTGNIVPDCWVRLAPVATPGSQTITTTTPASGTRNIYQYATATQNPIIVVLPPFSNIDAGTHWLRFKARVTTIPGILHVGYVTDVTDYDSFVLLESLTINNTAYTALDSEYTVAVPTTIPAGARLAIKNQADAKSYYWDDVYWEEAPACLPPSSLTATPTSLTEVTLAWNSAGSLFDVEWGTPGFTLGTGTQINGITTTFTDIVVTADTNYQFYVRQDCDVAGVSIWAGPFNFKTGYCDVTSTNTSTYGISNFTTTGGITNINNTSGVGSYSNYTSQSVSQFEGGADVQFTITYTTGTAGMRVWIDWNNNMVFDPSELVYSSGAYVATGTGTITIPAGTPVGDYRMRVVANWLNTTPPACGDLGNATYGEAEDYTFSVIVPPTCMPPTGLSATPTSLTSVTLGWTSTGSLFDLEWGPAGFTVGTGTQIYGLTTNSTSVTTVIDTPYQFYVRQDCSANGDGESLWAGPFSFQTGYCTPAYLYGCSNGSKISNFETTDAIINIANNTGTATCGANGYNNFTSMAVSTIESGTVSFNVGVGSYSGGVKVWIDWNNNGVFETSELMSESAATIAAGGTYSGTITVPLGTALGDYRMRVRVVEGSTTFDACSLYNYGETEDYTVTIITPPTCLPPTALGFSSVSATEAMLNWTSAGNNFDVEYGVSGFTLGNGTQITDIPTNSTLIPVVIDTAYQFYVRQNCGVDGVSVWVGPFSFYTGYCAVTSTSTAYGISNFVTTGGIVNINNASTGGSYSNYTAQSVAQFEGGADVQFTITSANGTAGMRIWIDWNNDFDFNDPGELVYSSGAYVNPGTGTITIPAGTPVGDYRMRVVANWLSTTPSACGDLGNALYGEAEDYTFSVIVPPLCMPPTGLSATPTSLTSVTLGWTSTGSLFDVEWGPTGFTVGTGTQIYGLTTNSTSVTTVIDTPYQFYVRQDCSANGDGESLWAGPFSFQTGYCTPAYLYGCSNGSKISNFETTDAIINIANNTGTATCGANGYNNFTSMAVSTIESGTVSFNVGVGSYSGGVKVWIDWNNNGVFETSELMSESAATIAAGGTYSGTITVPLGTALGDYRMRVRVVEGSTTFDACSLYNYGETEDYTVTIITPPACLPPNTLTATPTSLSEVTLGWTSAGSLFDVEWGPQGFTLGSGTQINDVPTNSTSVSVTIDVPYQFYVRQDCNANGDGESLWVGPFNFKTGYCVPAYLYGCTNGAKISNFETFDALENIANNTGTGSCGANGYNNFSSISAVVVEGAVVPFTVGVGSYSGGVKIWVDWNENGVFETSEIVAASAATIASGGTFTDSFTIPTGTPIGEYRLRVRVVEGSTTFDACNSQSYGETEDYTLEVITPPACMFPQNLQAVNISASSVSLSWTSTGTVFEIEYGPQGFTPGTGTIIPEVGNPYTLGGLTGGVAYQFYVRQDCTAAGDDYSLWRGPLTFTPGVFQGNIPTLLNANPQVEDIACATSFAIDVPTGQQIASLSVQYVMTSANPAYTSHQRSVLYSSTLGMGEATVALPVGGEDFPGVIYYNRTVDFANGATGTVEFELKAWRTTGGTGCGTTLVFVEDGTWVLNATFEDIPSCPNPATDLGYINPTADSVDLVWTSAETGTFQVKWGNVGFNPELTGTEISDIDTFSYTLSGLDSSIQYDFYVRRDCSTDDEDDFGEWVGPVRFNSGHCIPYATQGFYFTLFNTTNAVENVTYSYPDTALGTGYVNSTTMIITEDAGETFNFTSNFVGGASGLRIWVDWNNDFIFGDDEEMFFLAGGTGTKSGTITIPVGTPGGDYRMRVRAQSGATANPPACGLITQGEALDFTLRVSCDEMATPTGLATQQFEAGETLADLDVTGDNLVWYADEDLTIVLDPSTELVDATIYYVVSTNGGCQSDYLAVTVEQTSGVADFNNFGFRYYPNPVTDMMYLSANTPISNVTVINMLGQEVNVPANSDNTSLDMSGLPTGNYLIKVTIEGVSKMLKVVKK